MRIVNQTRGTTIATSVEIAKSPWRRMLGLLGRKSLEPGQALVIEPCRSVHTAFMRFAIDVVYVDRAWRVVKVVRHLRPYRASVAFAKAYASIELLSGTVAQTGTTAGDVLALED